MEGIATPIFIFDHLVHITNTNGIFSTNGMHYVFTFNKSGTITISNLSNTDNMITLNILGVCRENFVEQSECITSDCVIYIDLDNSNKNNVSNSISSNTFNITVKPANNATNSNEINSNDDEEDINDDEDDIDEDDIDEEDIDEDDIDEEDIDDKTDHANTQITTTLPGLPKYNYKKDTNVVMITIYMTKARIIWK